MCCRYYVKNASMDQVLRDVPDLQQIRKEEWDAYTGKDIHPGDLAPVISRAQGLSLSLMRFGFAKPDGKGLYINARSETVTDKYTFRESVLHRRACIPISNFYEWDSERIKVTIDRSDAEVMYLCGIWRPEEDGNRFVILTTAANDSMSDIHDRMPLMVDADDVVDWIEQDSLLQDYLTHEMPSVDVHRPYEQLKLPF